MALFITACMSPLGTAAQDTVRTLDELEVSTQRPPSTIHTATPTQVMDIEKIEAQGALQLSDAVKRMAGVTLKDYGGVGGMKTVSARGLGTQFSTLTIDGVAVDNSQNGQVDLGRYLLGNAAYVSFSQGQQKDDLLSARAYAAGNVLSMVSAEPTFFLAERTNLKMGIEFGSFNMLSPSLLWEQKWNKRFKSSLWVNYLKSDGDYPFTLYYTADHNGKTSQERRKHSAMHMLTADASLFYTINKGNTLTTKLHYMRGMHQLPGPVVFYNQAPSAQSTHEEETFVQTRWRVEREKWKWQVLAKYITNNDIYEDSAFLQAIDHYIINTYRKQEGYLSGSVLNHATQWLDVSAATDASVSRLVSNLAYRNDVCRTNLASVINIHAHYKSVDATGHIIGTYISDRVTDIDTMPTYRKLSPYFALRWELSPNVSLRYFYKETYRVPNFSELYFFNSIPRNLRPEKAKQHNIGVAWLSEHVQATVDAYFNRVIDKIIAKPSTNMFYWSMENLGLVHILGVDATAELSLSPFTLQANYSFAHAVDLSNPNDAKTSGYQRRYTPRHSGGASARWENRILNLGTSAIFVGHRYAYPQTDLDSRMPAYCDITLSADHKFNLRWGTLRVQLLVQNLLDTQYEVVLAYPMMGRNYRLSLTYEY